MLVDITKEGTRIKIKVNHSRIDGENTMIGALKAGNYFSPDVTQVDFDFEAVGYINSLGITEVINIHRNFNEAASDKVKFRFINVDRKVLAILDLVEMKKIAEIIPL